MIISYLKLFLIIIHSIFCSVVALFLGIARAFNLYFFWSKVFSKGILLISGIKLKVSGLENFDHKKPYVFVSNHSSQYDIPTLQYGIPNKFSIVYKQELEKIPLFGWQLATGPYIKIDRKNAEKAIKSIEHAKQMMVQKSISILLFAEGTRSKTGEVQPFKRGAFYLASKVGFPIIPVTVSGTAKILPKGSFKINPGTISVHFGKPVDTKNLNTRKDEMELMERVRSIIIDNFEKIK